MKTMFRCIAAAVVALSALTEANAGLVVNGGFETGDFTGWTQFGNTGFTSVSSGTPHSGTYAADFGPVGSTGGIFQSTLATTAGASYTFSFWLANDGGTPNSVSVLFDGGSVLSLLDDAGFGYTQFSYNVTASTASTTITFEFQQDPAFWHLDDVDVNASSVPEPSTVVVWSLMAAIFGVAGVRKRRALKAVEA